MSPRHRAAWHFLAGALAMLLTFLVICATEAHCEGVSVAKPAAIYLSLSAADLGSTEWAMNQPGVSERNRWMRSDPIPKQLALAAVFTAADVTLQKRGHPGQAKALRITVAVLRVGAMVWNVRNARRQK